MPYYKKRRRFYRKKTSGVKGWKRKKKPKTSALVRQTEQNRKAIKELKKAPESKYVGSTVATAASNYCGQILQEQKVDAYGLGMSSSDWVGIQASVLPSTDYEAYAPVWQCPLVVSQGVGEKERVGNSIKMRNLIIKGTVVGGQAADNAGIYAGRQVKQTMDMLVVLDKSPPRANPTLTSSPYAPVFGPQYMPAQTFSVGTTWTPPWASSAARSILDNLKSCPANNANPPGLHCGNVTDQNNLVMSYFSRDEDGIGKDARFKLLMHKKYHVTQQTMQEAGEGNDASAFARTAHHFTEIIKAPFAFTFNSDKDVLPMNQRIYLIFVSNCPTKRSTQQGSPTPTWDSPTDYIEPPLVSTLCRLNFTDS